MPAPTVVPHPDAAVCDAVRVSPLPVLLIGLRDAVIVEISDGLARLFGGPRQDLLARPVSDLVVGDWTAEAILLLLAAGAVDGMRTQDWTWRRIDGGTFSAAGWLSTDGTSPPLHGVVVLLPVERGLGGVPEASAEDSDAPPLAVGTVDGGWVVDRVSAEVEDLVGFPPAQFAGMSLRSTVHPADLPALLIAVGHAWRQGGQPVAVGIRLRGADSGWVPVRIVVSSLDGQQAPAFGFAIASAAPAGGAEERANDLERRLRVLARELEAARLAIGLSQMPTAAELPALASLTARELEISRRLLAGDRVPLIAQSLFLSESTVRNHLTAVFRKVEVRSQQELLTMLRPQRREVPPTATAASPADS
ncbi:MAG: hypothetical protein NVSMB55_09030 [Mycobacteriales bacterium]